jgi:hypothetical protein
MTAQLLEQKLSSKLVERETSQEGTNSADASSKTLYLDALNETKEQLDGIAQRYGPVIKPELTAPLGDLNKYIHLAITLATQKVEWDRDRVGSYTNMIIQSVAVLVNIRNRLIREGRVYPDMSKWAGIN